MLTKVEFELVNSFFRQTCELGLAPLDWNEKELRATPTTKKWKRYFSATFTIVGCVYWAFVIARSPVTFEHYKISNKLDSAILHGLLFNIRFSVLIAQITSRLYMTEISCLQNSITTLNRKYGHSNLGREFSAPNLREKCLKFLVVSFYAFTSFFGMTFAVNPENPGFIFSVLSDSYRTIWMLGLFCAFEILFTFLLTVIFVTLIIVFFAYLTSVNFWLSYEWPLMKTSFEEATKVYRSIFVLSILQKLTYSGLYTPLIQMASGIASMTCTYVVIELRDRITIVTYLMCLVTIPIIYLVLVGGAHFMSNVYEFSTRFKDRLEKYNSDERSRTETKMNQLILKSLAPIKCSVGNTYFIDKHAKGTLLDFMISSAVYLLLI